MMDMATLSAEEIYRYAVLAGFTPDQAVTMTAIALAESSGRTEAHNPNGEDSRGLWQINYEVHPEFDGWDLYDPLTNARAAYSVSLNGSDISPWTTAHGIGNAAYLRYQGDADMAARINGDNAVGRWTGVEGYGHPAPAAGDGASAAASVVQPDDIPAVQPATGSGGNSTLDTFLTSAEHQVGDPYVWGVNASVDDADPTAFDCSELTRWAAGRAGFDLQDGTWLQYLQLKEAGSLISVDEAIHTPGALLFRFSTEPTPGAGRPDTAHVAISLGDGRTVEASDPNVGVIYGEADNGFNFAAVVPGISDGTATGTVQATTVRQAVGTASTATALAPAPVDSDGDGIIDDTETTLHLDPHLADTDADGLTDGDELLTTKTDPTRADTDHDLIADGAEVNSGGDPLRADADLDGRADGETGDLVDADHDRLSDALEVILGTDAHSLDSDRDGFADGAEYFAGYDPADAHSSPLADLMGSGSGDALDVSV
jgi:cell wall-associated NlpC family hydrolase